MVAGHLRGLHARHRRVASVRAAPGAGKVRGGVVELGGLVAGVGVRLRLRFVNCQFRSVAQPPNTRFLADSVAVFVDALVWATSTHPGLFLRPCRGQFRCEGPRRQGRVGGVRGGAGSGGIRQCGRPRRQQPALPSRAAARPPLRAAAGSVPHIICPFKLSHVRLFVHYRWRNRPGRDDAPSRPPATRGPARAAAAAAPPRRVSCAPRRAVSPAASREARAGRTGRVCVRGRAWGTGRPRGGRAGRGRCSPTCTRDIKP